MVSVTIPDTYGYVVLSVAATWLCDMVHKGFVSWARKKYDVKYPHCYAPHGHKYKHEFDCIQRAAPSGKDRPRGIVCGQAVVPGGQGDRAHLSLGAGIRLRSLMRVWCATVEQDGGGSRPQGGCLEERTAIGHGRTACGEWRLRGTRGYPAAVLHGKPETKTSCSIGG